MQHQNTMRPGLTAGPRDDLSIRQGQRDPPDIEAFQKVT
jgi:hypothetical protein